MLDLGDLCLKSRFNGMIISLYERRENKSRPR